MLHQIALGRWVKSCLAAISLTAGAGVVRACDDADAQPPFRPVPIRPVPGPVRPVPPPVIRPVPPPVVIRPVPSPVVIRPVPPPFVRYPFWPPTVVQPPVVVIRPVAPSIVVPSPVADTGMVITELAYGPALDAGLQQGDIIIRVDGARTRSFADLRALLVASNGVARFVSYRPSTGKIETRTVRVLNSLIGATVVETPIELAEPVEQPKSDGKT